MKNNKAQPYDENHSRGDRATNPARDKMELTDPKRDEEHLRPDEATIELPDVKDIPGQEFVHLPPMGMMADTTISSADEEGEGLFEDDDEDETDRMSTEGDRKNEENVNLQRTDDYIPARDEEQLQRASLEHADFEGEGVNDRSFSDGQSGVHLDIDDSLDATRTDTLAQRDEENKYFSPGSDDNGRNENKP